MQQFYYGWKPATELVCRPLRTPWTGDGAVAGPVLADYVSPPPAWLARGRLHGNRRTATGSGLQRWWRVLFPEFAKIAPLPSGTPIPSCDTGNVLFRSSIVLQDALRFDEAIGRYGYGADTYFFMLAHRAGRRLVWSNEAVVHHRIPPARMAFRWLVRQAFQQGLCMPEIQARLGVGTSPRVWMATVRTGLAAYNILAAPLACLVGREHMVRRVLTGAHNVGYVLGALGLKIGYDRRAAAEPGETGAATTRSPALPV